MKRTAAILLAISMLLALCACGAAPADPQHEYRIQENTGENKESYPKERYPYFVRTESATWYLSRDDIELLGKEAMFEGLRDILQYQEEDFADARAALSGYIREEIPPIDILTDFSEKASAAEVGGAYYNQEKNYIKVFRGWEKTKYTLLHEYVHYLTLSCTDTPVSSGLFAEGIAEYVSKIVCRDRMLRSYFGNIGEEDKSILKANGAWNEEEDCLDPPRYFYGMAEFFAKGRFVGQEFFSTSDVTIVRTPEIQQNPAPGTVSHFEAACIMAYLVETYTRETVFSHLDMDPEDLEQVFGEPFPVLYEHWAAWNAARCGELGLIT